MKQEHIQIQGLAVFASVGVLEEERVNKQKLLIDIEMETQHPFDSLNEDITRTADYEKAAQRIQTLCSTLSCQLIETLALKIASLLLDEFPLERVTVRVRKFILADTEFVAVQTTRERSH